MRELFPITVFSGSVVLMIIVNGSDPGTGKLQAKT